MHIVVSTDSPRAPLLRMETLLVWFLGEKALEDVAVDVPEALRADDPANCLNIGEISRDVPGD